MKADTQTPTKGKVQKTPKNTPATIKKPKKKVEVEINVNNYAPNTPNKPIQSPNQRFEQRNSNNKPFNNNNKRNFGGPPHNNRPFNRNQPQNNRPFNRNNGPFNRNNGPFNRNNGPFNRNYNNGPRQQGIKRKAPYEQEKFDCPETKRRTVFVGNVPLQTTDPAIKKLFSKYGTIESIRFGGVPRNDMHQMKKMARTEMHAFVVFTNSDEADKALEVNGQIFNEHCLRVNLLGSRPGSEDKSIFVGNLPLDTRDNELIELFKEVGDIESVHISRDPHTTLGRGFGYVNFKDTDGAERALQLENVTIKRTLTINRYNKKPDASDDATWTSVQIKNAPKHYKRSYFFHMFKTCGQILRIEFKHNQVVYVAFETPEGATEAMKLRHIISQDGMFMSKHWFDPRRNVFLRDVPLDTEEADVTKALEACGTIKRCVLLLKPKPPHTTGFCIVQFVDAESAQKADALKQIVLKDKTVTIENYAENGKRADNKTEQENGESAEDDDDSDDEDMEQGDDDEEEDDDDDDDKKDDDAEEEEDSEQDEEADDEDDNEDDDQQEQGEDDDDDDDDDDDGDDDDDDDSDYE